MITHRLFLVWLLYITVVTFLVLVGYDLGYIQMALKSDLTYITYFILLTFILSEMYTAFRIFQVNREIEKAKKVRQHLLTTQSFRLDDIPEGILKQHIRNIMNLMQNKKHDINQRIILDSLGDELNSWNYGNYLGELEVRLGLLGTVVGLIIAFMPFIEMAFAGTTFESSMIQQTVTQLMIGVSAAFFTTAAGLVFGTLLIVSGKIYDAGADNLLDQITIISETIVIPRLEARYETE
ncbi:MAG: MotA/TolQ/ExbB proton channel family protein [Richelia sp. RM2_1_2]|nr:MotA/TolQ/ExbB proton channel family protein [Richelia sp. RM2_1_2]